MRDVRSAGRGDAPVWQVRGQVRHTTVSRGDRSGPSRCRHRVARGAGQSRRPAPRFSGGKGWGLNGNDVVEDMGPTGISRLQPLGRLCRRRQTPSTSGWMLVASGAHDCVPGRRAARRCPRGFIQTSGVDEETDIEYLRQLCVGMPGPAFWAALCRRPHAGLRHDRGGSRPDRRQVPPDLGAQTRTPASARSSPWKRCSPPRW